MSFAVAVLLVVDVVVVVVNGSRKQRNCSWINVCYNRERNVWAELSTQAGAVISIDYLRRTLAGWQGSWDDSRTVVYTSSSTVLGSRQHKSYLVLILFGNYCFL